MAALLVCGYCYADELTTVTAPHQAGVTNKQAVQLDNATAAFTVYPKETTRRLLPNKRGDLLHIAFEEGYIGKGVTLEPVVLQSAYAIEVILKPSEKQVPSAVVLGNIYGNKEGFRIQNDPIDKNTYAMSFNDVER